MACLRLIQDGFGHVDCKLNCIENLDPATTTTVSTTPQSTTTTIENRGAFNNYVDQILPNFDPLPRKWTIVDILHTAYYSSTWPSVDFLLTTYLPLIVYVVIEWSTRRPHIQQTPLFFWYNCKRGLLFNSMQKGTFASKRAITYNFTAPTTYSIHLMAHTYDRVHARLKQLTAQICVHLPRLNYFCSYDFMQLLTQNGS